MDPEKNTSPEKDENNKPSSDTQDTPADALSRTPDELDQEQAKEASSSAVDEQKPVIKKESSFKKFLRRMNVYFLLFMLVIIVAGAITAVSYLNSQTEPEQAAIEAQELTEDALQQLANTDANVGSASQTLNIQGNAVVAGQTLMRGDLSVAGNLQTGGSIQGPSLTISGESNLGSAQINDLQVAQNIDVQGDIAVQGINVAGGASFGGAVSAQQLTVSRLILSGNASLQVPNHIGFTGPSPSRTINAGVLGSGGSASVDGSDTAGTVNINTGGNPSAGCFIRVTFQQRFTNRPHVIVSPVGRAAGQTQYYVDRDNTGFNICTSSAAPAGQAFAFDYFITN